MAIASTLPQPSFGPLAPVTSRPNMFAAIGAFLLLVEMIVVIGRTPEIAIALAGTAIYHQLIIFTICLALVPLSGGLVNASRESLFWILLALHIWYAATVPFSYWRGGSFAFMLELMRIAPIFVFFPSFVLNLKQLERMFWAAGAGLATALVWIIVGSRRADDVIGDRFALASGRFGNSNDLASFLLCFMPFWLYVVVNRKSPFLAKVLCALLSVLSIWQCLRTGSRGGLVTMAALVVVAFVYLSPMNKLKIGVPAAILIFVFFISMPEAIRDRLMSFGETAKDASALESSESRWRLFLESVDLTVRHPVFGLGVGIYIAGAADILEKQGQRAHWQVTHNAYAQVAAETGIPGAVLMIASLVVGVRRLFRIRKAARRSKQHMNLFLMSNCLLFSMFVYILNGMFAPTGYDLTVYILLGFVAALTVVARNEGLSLSQNFVAALDPASAPPATKGIEVTWPSKAPANAPPQTPVPVSSGNQYGDAPWRINPRRNSPKPNGT